MTSISRPSFPIQKLFPKNDYSFQCKCNKKIIPIYLIALKQPNDTIFNQLLKFKNPSYAEPQFGLTALAVATMVGNHEVMRFLLDQGVNPLSKDYAGLTPLHYASILEDQVSLKLLQEKVKTQKVSLNVFENFPGWKSIVQPNLPKPDDIVLEFLDFGKKVPLTASDFFKKTGARFYDGLVGSHELLMDMFVHRLKLKLAFTGDEALNNFLMEKYSNHLRNPSKFYMGIQGAAGNGIFAGQTLSAFEICSVYGGELFCAEGNLTSPIGDYYFPGVNGFNVRNQGPEINDSFPNAIFFPIFFPDGNKLTVLIPIREIKEGEGIFVDYLANHSLKREPHAELNLEELEIFFKNNQVDHLLKSLQMRIELNLKRKNPHSILLICAETARLSYIFTTPTALLYLYFKQIVSLKDIKKIYSNPIFKEKMDTIIIDGTIHMLERVEKYFSTHKKDQIDPYEGEILNLIKNHSIKGILETLDCLISVDISRWKKSLFSKLAEAADQLEILILDIYDSHRKEMALIRFTDISKNLPPEFKAKLSFYLLQILTKNPSLSTIFHRLTNRFRDDFELGSKR